MPSTETVAELGGSTSLSTTSPTSSRSSRSRRSPTSSGTARCARTSTSFFWTTRAALAHLPDGGAIVNTSSINGLRGNKTLIDYSATKGAINALTYSLAQALVERRSG